MTMQEQAKKALESDFVKELTNTAAAYGYEVRHPWFTEYAPGDKNLQVEFWIDCSKGFEIYYKDRCTLKPSEKIEFEVHTSSWGDLAAEKFNEYIDAVKKAGELQNYLNNLDWNKAPVIQYQQED